MLDKRRKYKRIVTVIILLVLAGVGLSGLRIRSVGRYQQEQKQLAKDLLVDETPNVAVWPEQSVQPEGSDAPAASAGVLKEDEPEQTAGTSAQSTGADTEKKQTPVPTGQGVKAVHTKMPADGTGKKKDSTKTDSAARQTAKPTKKKTTPKNTPTVKTPSDNDGSFVCTITIRCDNLLQNWDTLSDSVKKKVPKDGMILAKTSVRMTSSDTAYSILQKVCKAKDIALDAEYGNVFSSWYVRGIHYLYEKEAGETSGWLYHVNGRQPEFGASGCYLHAGDDVEWFYSSREEF